MTVSASVTVALTVSGTCTKKLPPLVPGVAVAVSAVAFPGTDWLMAKMLATGGFAPSLLTATLPLIGALVRPLPLAAAVTCKV